MITGVFIHLGFPGFSRRIPRTLKDHPKNNHIIADVLFPLFYDTQSSRSSSPSSFHAMSKKRINERQFKQSRARLDVADRHKIPSLPLSPSFGLTIGGVAYRGSGKSSKINIEKC